MNYRAQEILTPIRPSMIEVPRIDHISKHFGQLCLIIVNKVPDIGPSPGYGTQLHVQSRYRSTISEDWGRLGARIDIHEKYDKFSPQTSRGSSNRGVLTRNAPPLIQRSHSATSGWIVLVPLQRLSSALFKVSVPDILDSWYLPVSRDDIAKSWYSRPLVSSILPSSAGWMVLVTCNWNHVFDSSFSVKLVHWCSPNCLIDTTVQDDVIIPRPFGLVLAVWLVCLTSGRCEP